MRAATGPVQRGASRDEPEATSGNGCSAGQIASPTTPTATANHNIRRGQEAKRLTRVFFQDEDTKTVRWADLMSGQPLKLSTPQVVKGFPSLDPMKQTLVQMEMAQGYILIGVRDEQDGKFQSGWVLIDCGVETESHGDHLDWVYARDPQVRAVQLDDQQGNPAHLYVYDDVFYVANDRKNGFTRLAPSELKTTDGESAIRAKASFHSGGGGHITLAVAERVAYSSWIDRDGPNKGRVDLTPVSASGAQQPAASIFLSSGGIHGATACAGKVFFAPTAGINWVVADGMIPVDPKSISIQHIDLGQLGDRPRRTGAFTTMGNRVAFLSGIGKDSELGIIQADKTPPALTRLTVPVNEGAKASGLELIKPRRGNPVAILFEEIESDGPSKCQLKLIELDPNGNAEWEDMRVGPSISVGKAKIEGHGGHHGFAVDSDRFRGVLTNPGDGTIQVFSLDSRRIENTFEVGGAPSKIIARGGPVH